MEMGFEPTSIIQRLCEHHKVKPERLLTAMLEALAHYPLFGQGSFPDLEPNPGLPPEHRDVYSEIQAYMRCAKPPVDPTTRALRCLMDAVSLCIEHDRRRNYSLHDELAADEQESDHQWMQGTLLGVRANEQRVLLLAMKECRNQIEAMALERAIEGEKG
jgi:hypothetical protein